MSLTLVTVLFDLTKRSPTPRRSMEWLIENGQRVLALKHPMVIYADKHLVGQLAHERAIRDLYDQTKFIIQEFDELPHYGYWKSLEPNLHLIENRDVAKDRLDNFVINWEKPGLIAAVAKQNPFNTTHVGWINLGIQNIKAFDSFGWEDAFDPPDRLHVQQQRYLNRAIVDDPMFYKWGRCVTAGGFLTGSLQSVIDFADDFYLEFGRALSMGLAPGDEDVIGTMIVNHPEKYHISYGDYGQILCNAKRPRWGSGTTQWSYNHSLCWMISAALSYGDTKWAANLWQMIMQSYRDGYFKDDLSVLELFRPALELTCQS